MKKDLVKQQNTPIRTQDQYLNFIKKNTSLIQRHAKILRNMRKQSIQNSDKLLDRLTINNTRRNEFYKKYNISQTLSPFQSRYNKGTDNQLGNSPDYPRYRQTINHINKSGVLESQYIYDIVTPINLMYSNFPSQKKYPPSDDNVKFPNIKSSKSSKKSTIQIDDSLFSQHLSKRINIQLQGNFRNRQQQFPKSLQTHGSKVYDLIPAFRPQNDYLKAIVRKAKKSRKILAARQAVIDQKKRYLENFLESKIILQKSEDKLNGIDSNLLKLSISLGLEQENFMEEIANNTETKQDTKFPQQQVIPLQNLNNASNEDSPKIRFKKTVSIDPKTTSTIKLQRSNSMRGQDAPIYMMKITSYRQFLFQMNLAHRVFDSLFLKQDYSTYKESEKKYKFYIGRGNNSLLVKSLLKRRYWWVYEQDPKKANFVWTQLKINILYQFMVKSDNSHLRDKLDKQIQQQPPSSPKKKQKKSKKPEIVKVPLKSVLYRAPLPAGQKKIFTKADQNLYNKFAQDNDLQKYQNFQKRLKFFPQGSLKKLQLQKGSQKVHNHFQFNYHIGNKKALFYHLKQYYQLQHKNVFQVIPLTFHIKKGKADPQYNAFVKEFKRIKNQHKSEDEHTKKKFSKNVWIVKPGQLSNRGNGITVIDQIYELNSILQRRQKHSNGTEMTYIVQKYIEKPLLYNKRKFDIRHYMMASRLHGRMRAYWFGQGYIRTSSTEYNLQEIDNQIMHLTNDAIQKYSAGYGKYQQGNKVSYNQFQRYLDSTFGEKKQSFADNIYPKMKAIALDAFKATYLKMDPDYLEHTFQIFGLDFMIDSSFDVWLIEVNTNPCLELSSNLLSRIIPTMLEQTFRLTLDVIYPPPAHYPNSQKYLAPDNPLQRLQFELIFDEGRDGKELEQLYKNEKQIDIQNIEQDDEVYQNDGKQIDLRQDID